MPRFMVPVNLPDNVTLECWRVKLKLNISLIKLLIKAKEVNENVDKATEKVADKADDVK